MFSACVARLISELSGLKIQAIINGQINIDNCLEWGNKISKLSYFQELKSIHPIHNRLIKEPEFMVSELYFGSLKSVIISFSANLEFFLKDSMQLCMMRNYSLLKKGLIESNQVITPKDIVDMDSIESVRLKYINIISNRMCSGEMWSGKFKRYIKFLALPNELLGKNINKEIDSIWRMRNDIAHANTKVLSIEYDKVMHKFDRNINSEQYAEFAVFFIKLIDKTIDLLEKVDRLSLEKWEVTDTSLLYRK
ncbi:HEPN domain-containing protein [Limosilactobacillus reuteri subsp. suis]|uniref:HEPN domain-containing protein n=1 Tax=Limosilactobacillus reuteri TaxID=1598 RepID=UPI0039944986